MRNLIIIFSLLFSTSAFSKRLKRLKSKKRVVVRNTSGKKILNLSGITFHTYTNSFWIVRNHDKFLHELDLNLKTIRDIKLKGWDTKLESDLEGIASLGPGQLALVNESGQIYIGNLENSQSTLFKKKFTKWQFDSNPSKIPHNKGPEGLAFQSDLRKIFVAYEGKRKFPTKIISFFLSSNFKIDPTSEASVPFDIKKSTKAKNITGLHYDKETNSLLAVSRSSKKLYQLSMKGELLGIWKLPPFRFYEGVTIHPTTREIITASELNVIDVFSVELNENR